MTREEAINIVQGARQYLTAGNPIWDTEKVDEAMKLAIEALQDRPSGEWTYLHGSIGSYMTMSCPFCGETFDDVAEWKYNFCPNCGADMRGDNNETD